MEYIQTTQESIVLIKIRWWKSIVDIRENGDIYVKWKFIENDKEVAEWLKELIWKVTHS